VPLIVKPNPRRARAFMDSPSESSFVRRYRPAAVTPAAGRLVLAVAIVGVILLVLGLLAVV